LNRKGTLEQEENNIVLMVFVSKENLVFLPCHITDKMFVAEIAGNTTTGCTFSMTRKKNSSFLCPGKSDTSCVETSTRLMIFLPISRN
jgi:hypothetical protein